MLDGKAQTLNADFLKFVEARFPEWLPYVHHVPKTEAGLDHVKLTVPGPLKSCPVRSLEVSTWDEEITVSFGDFHTHFPWPDGFDGTDNRNRVMDFLKSIVDEEVVVASVWSKGRLRRSSTLRSDSLPSLTCLTAGDHELRIASWRGSYDTVLHVDWQHYLKASHLGSRLPVPTMLLAARIFAVTLLLATGAALGLVLLAGAGYFSSGKPIFYGSDGTRTLLCFTDDDAIRLPVEFRDNGRIAIVRTLQGREAHLIFKKGWFVEIYSGEGIEIRLDPEVQVTGVYPMSVRHCDWE